jgi:uncharacterized protein
MFHWLVKRCERRDVQRAVIDTNIWVSAVLNPTGPPAQILEALMMRRFVSVTSEPLLVELDAVLARPRIASKYHVSREDREEYLDLVRVGSIVVPVDGVIQVCRDPDDDGVIETALRGRANALVSRDDDLKHAVEVITYLEESNIEVLTVRHFLSAIFKTD